MVNLPLGRVRQQRAGSELRSRDGEMSGVQQVTQCPELSTDLREVSVPGDGLYLLKVPTNGFTIKNVLRHFAKPGPGCGGLCGGDGGGYRWL